MTEKLKILLDGLEENISKLQIGFDDYQNESFDKRKPEFFCLELNGEAGELANIEKKSWKGQDIAAERFEDETADVLIALFNYANARGISLGKAVAEKLNKIETKRLELTSQGKRY